MRHDEKRNFIKPISILVIILLLVAAVGFIYYAISNSIGETRNFLSDGFAILLDKESTGVKTYTFTNGTKYSYKKYKDAVTFDTADKNVSISTENIVHYANGTYLALNNMVGIDLDTISNPIIIYYNIYKNSIINSNGNNYYITSYNGEDINFGTMLIRVSENKYLLLSENICLITDGDKLTDFGNYVYFEYLDNKVVQVYNANKSMKTIAQGQSITTKNISIDLNSQLIAKDSTNYITLSNLVMDMNSNIDLIPIEEPEDEELDIEKSDVSDSIIRGDNTKNFNEQNSDEDEVSVVPSNNEVVVDEKDPKEPVFKVTELDVDSLQINAKIEVTDDDSTLTSETKVSIVENSSNETVYPAKGENGLFDIGTYNIYVSCAGLKPDTEYTLYASATYMLGDVSYDKTFVTKIFRTPSVGLNLVKGFVTQNSIQVDVLKETYSNVSSAKLILYKGDSIVNSETLDLAKNNSVSSYFGGLDSNTKYTLKITDIYSDGVMVDEGFEISKDIYTLKNNPTVGKLDYKIDKKDSKFSLSIGDIIDDDKSITSYRYEIYDTKNNMEVAAPIAVIEKDNPAEFDVKVDDVTLFRGVSYTYRLIVTSYDNEKYVESVFSLGKNMKLDGVAFPTLRFTESNVTWERITGAIIIDDPSSTIMDSKYTIIYKNSLGEYTSLTTYADTSTNTLPIDVNGLRANETYTFDVYTTINLQDGNGSTPNVYIGSVTCQTGEPQELTAIYSTNADFTNLFSFNLGLVNDKAQLEASTISELRLTLYEGSTTDGKAAVWTKIIDENSNDYESTIKDTLYDATTNITPKTFNTRNSSLTSKVYTVKISDVYDYTKYKNEIKIVNDTFSFKINNLLPSLPADVNDAVAITEIKNKVASSFNIPYDDNLEPNTTVGYSILADFDNSSGYGKYVEYYVYEYDQTSDKYIKLDNLTRTVDFVDGVLPPTIYNVGYGTNDDLDTDMLRRGNKYYFTYKVFLEYDQDNDGLPDIATYPDIIESGVELRSSEFSIYKQAPNFVMFLESYTLSNEDSNFFTAWANYKLSDIDNAIYIDNGIKYLYYISGNGVNIYSYDLRAQIENTDEYKGIGIYRLRPGEVENYKIRVKYLKEAKNGSMLTVYQQYNYPFTDFSNLNYTASIQNNRLEIEFTNYLNYVELFKNIYKISVEITPTDSSQSLTLDNLTLTGSSIYIPLYDIYSILGKEFTVKVKIEYDSGQFRMTNKTTNGVIQIGGAKANNYLFINQNNGKIEQSTDVREIYDTRFDKENNRLFVNQSTFDLIPTNKGLLLDNNSIVIKTLDSKEIKSDDVLVFDSILPAINLYNESQTKLNITSLLNSAIVNAELSWFDKLDIKDNLVYVDLYQTDSDGRNEKLVKTLKMDYNEFNQPFTINDLNYFTNYYLMFYTYVNVDGTYQKTYLYDVVRNITGNKYRFKTLTDVGIDNFKYNLVATSYNNKYLNISYNLSYLEGYNSIAYKLFECNSNYSECNSVNVDIPSSTFFSSTMGVKIDANPAKGNIKYNTNYRIIISPIGSITNNKGLLEDITLGSKVYDFNLGDPTMPTVAITPSKTNDKISYRVTIVDPSYVIVGGKYSYELVDSAGNVIINENDDNISEKYKLYEFNESNGLQFGETYTFVVKIATDTKNKGKADTTTPYSKSLTFGDVVDTGDTVIEHDSEGNNFSIYYFNPYKITDITKVIYTVTAQFNENESFNYSSSGTFNLEYDSNVEAFKYTLNIDSPSFKSGYLYYVTLNYYNGSTLVAQDELRYYYR